MKMLAEKAKAITARKNCKVSNLRGFSVKFNVQGGIAYPVDTHLHKLAVEFADKHLNAPCNLADYNGVTVVAKVDDDGKPVEILAMNARVPRWDYPIWRFIDEAAGEVLIERTRASLDDEGLRGGEIFVHVSEAEKPESRCPNWKEFLKAVNAEKLRWRSDERREPSSILRRCPGTRRRVRRADQLQAVDLPGAISSSGFTSEMPPIRLRARRRRCCLRKRPRWRRLILSRPLG